LTRAIVLERISAAAKHVATNEVAAARDEDSATWHDVTHAFGIGRQDAEQRFRTLPMGLPQ